MAPFAPADHPYGSVVHEMVAMPCQRNKLWAFADLPNQEPRKCLKRP
jgi:hypothetical protein